MSRETFDDNCQGCRPSLLDVRTGLPLPDSDPIMKAVNQVWDKTTLEERQAFHRVCCQNSREAADLAVMQSISDRIQKETGP